MNSLKIKVCGMRDYENIKQLVQFPIDYIGFIFYPASPRFAGLKIDSSILEIIPNNIKKVGVFVNEPLKELLRIVKENQLECVQLHGNEIPDYCNAIKEEGYTIIKAFKAEPEKLTCETTSYRFAADYLLFDTPTANYGGSGIKFNWEILKQQKFYLPFFLSGGISPGDEDNIKKIDIPGFYAIDINSQFEIGPGIKNIKMISDFIKNLN